MKKVRVLTICLAVLALGSTSVFAEDNVEEKTDNKIAFDLSLDYFGKYIWRGQNLSDNSVFQPGFSIGYGNLTAGIWGNMDMTNINGNSGDFSELDYSLDYSGTFPGIEKVSYSVGVIYYDFPGTATQDTTEVYWGLSVDVPSNPSITVYHDLDEAEGSYVSLGFGHSIEKIAELGPDMPVGMELGASLGWGSASYNSYYWGTTQSKMQDLAFSLAFPVEIAGWTVSPNLNYVTLVSEAIRNSNTYGPGDGDFFFAGVSVSKSF